MWIKNNFHKGDDIMKMLFKDLIGEMSTRLSYTPSEVKWEMTVNFFTAELLVI